jgi:hypothetical protein
VLDWKTLLAALERGFRGRALAQWWRYHFQSDGVRQWA